MSTPLIHLQFIQNCNDAGAAKNTHSKRYDQAARSCGKVEPFTFDGLSFLAGLLSDRSTAAGEANEKGQMPDGTKIWAMEFLGKFNPAGHLAFEDPEALRNFARQLVEGREQYEPVAAVVFEERKLAAKIPSKEILEQIILKLRNDGEEITQVILLDEVEEYYENEKMTLPDNWERLTENNLKKWKLI